MGDKKSLEADRLLDKMLSDLERRREMEEEAVLKALFPRGSSGSVPASAAGREAMPGTVTGGPPRAQRQDTGENKSREAAKLLDQMLSEQERRRGDIAGTASQEGSVEDGLELLGASAGVSAGSTFPSPGLDAVYKLSSHQRGPPTGKAQDMGDKKSLEADRLLDKMLSDLERRRVMKGKTVLKALFPRGSSGSVPASAAGREAMPGTVTGGWDHDMSYSEKLMNDHFKILELGRG
ncbi:uncharacterized protein LOC130258488 [Oenanthe melanoleuca]|uniref:uncharacterized protein LOC130258488 n=1 Tax=Oenanthe melanoleuca TaxID=2939378 RepID=UPI0024C1A1B8|nr:uncharacterized protein LOC130258488 [Oenanthe melanoleuca]